MSDLRDKIARALFFEEMKPAHAKTGDRLWEQMKEQNPQGTEWHEAADAVLTVIDLDKVRAEGYDRAWSEVRNIPHWWNPNTQYGEFDMLPLGPDETTEQGAFMAVYEVLTNNPYRKAER